MKIPLPPDHISVNVNLETEDSKAKITVQGIGPATMEITGPVRLTGSYDNKDGIIDNLLCADCWPSPPASLDISPAYAEADVIRWMDKHFFILSVQDVYATFCLETSNPFYFGLHYANTYATRVESTEDT